MINNTVKAKEDTERVQIEEALNVAYINLSRKSKYSIEANLDDAVEIVQNQGYKDRIVGVSGGAYKLSKENIILSKTGEENTDTITIEKDTSASSGGTWYAVINGKYFKIEEKNGDIKVAKEPSNVNPSSGASGDTINITNNDVTLANANIATFQVTEGKNIQLTASNEGSSTITITANGITYTANLTVVGSFEQAPANLDGAVELLAATDNSNQNGANVTLQNIEMTTSNPDVATITTEGIVKCNKVAGKTAIISAKQGGTTRYFKVKSTAKIATSIGSGAPAVPEGFTAIDTNDAKWSTATAETGKGLVIMDEKGNQFVWVPVSSLNSMFMCKEHSSTSDCDIKLNSNRTGLECRTEAHKDTNGNYCTEIVGKLYATETGEKFGTIQQTYTEDSGFREPDILSNTSFGDWSGNKSRGYALLKQYVTGIAKDENNVNRTNEQIQTVWTNQLKTEFNKMAISVAKNGGFYIGRYEASLINNETRVVAGATSMSADTTSAGTWYGLYQKQRDFISAGSLRSTMIWGCQYDAMMNWMQSTGIDVKATANSSNNTERNADESKRTGVVAKDKLNNIYDIFGLRFEWTLEAGTSKIDRVSRGGNYYYFNRSPSVRGFNYPSYTDNDYYSSRPTLYIK